MAVCSFVLKLTTSCILYLVSNKMGVWGGGGGGEIFEI